MRCFGMPVTLWIRFIRDGLPGRLVPFSQVDMAAWETPRSAAASCWLRPSFSRNSAIQFFMEEIITLRYPLSQALLKNILQKVLTSKSRIVI